MNIENNILKYCLRNAYFITGTAYAGKSTMVKMLAERYGMTACGENYHMAFAEKAADPETQPNLCYFRTMKSWEEFVRRTPEEYERWIYDVGREAAGIEVVDLGVDVAPEDFVQTAIDRDCGLIACSSLLTTAMNEMRTVVKLADEAGIRGRVKILIGGAPITEDFCREIGADAYTPDAAAAARMAVRLLSE